MVKTKFVLLFCLLFMGIFSSLFSVLIPSVKAVHADQEFTFQAVEFFNYPNVPNWYEGREGVGAIETYNTRLPTNITQHYNATYSFEKDLNKTNIDISFVDNIGNDYEVEITSNLLGHNDVINVFRDGSFEDFPYNTINITNGILEGWIYTDDTGIFSTWDGIDRLTNVVYFGDSDFIRCYYDATYTQVSNLISWVHVKMEFNCITDTQSIWINGIKILDNENFYLTNVGNNVNKVSLGVGDLESAYWDAIGYSWDGYNATYSFTGETGEVGTNIDFVDYEGGSGIAEVINLYNNHYEILNFTSDNTDYMYNSFPSQILGTIEFWHSYASISGYFKIHFRDSSENVVLYIRCYDNFLRIYHGSTFTDTTIYDLTNWGHIRIEFNCSSNTFSLWFNNILEIDNLNFYLDGNRDNISKMEFQISSLNRHLFFDGIGYSWDPFYEIGDNLEYYAIGDNIVPYFLTENSTDTLLYEVDKNEFYYYDYTNPNFDIYANGDDNPSGWTDIENGQDNTNIYEKSADDNVVRIVGDGITAEGTGLYQDFNQEYGNVNVTWNVDLLDVDNSGGQFLCDIYSSDDTLVCSISLTTPNVIKTVLSYYDGVHYEQLEILLPLTSHTFNVFIDYSSDTFLLKWFQESNLNGTYFLPLNATGKDGLGKIEYTMEVSPSPPNNFEVDLDKVGVYVNGTSLVQDFAFVNFWNILNVQNGHQHFTSDYSFIEILSESDDLGYAFFTALVPYASDAFPAIFERDSYIYNVTKRKHLQDFEFLPGEKYIYGPGIRAFFTSRSEILNISYRTAIMWDSVGNLRYTLEFDTSMDLTSYFYVSDSGSLLFNHYANDDSLEFIQATFNIVNTQILNHTLVHDIFKSGLSEVILRLNYSDDTSTLIYFQNYPLHGNLVLPDKVLNQFIVLVSDNDLYNNANTSGRVETLILQYIPDWTLNIVSVDLITALIPLMVIIIVSVVFSQVLGKESIVPLMLIMSIILFIVELLPFWLLFVSITVFVGIILSDKDEVS